MKKLEEIIRGIKVKKLTGPMDVTVSSVVFDSRQVEECCAFVAVKGTQSDGHNYINLAIAGGARVIVLDDPEFFTITDGVTYILTEHSSDALGKMASNFMDNPSGQLILIGITGTNGKTTTVTLLHEVATNLGYKCGLISTIKNLIGEKVYPSTHTTPDPVQLNNLLSQMVTEGCHYCFMEVSSHAMVQNRTAGLEFSGGIFSNITHDHLDYHKTFNEYLAAKKKFFDQLPEKAFVLINTDDRNGRVMVQNTRAKVSTYGLKSLADFRCRILENTLEGLHLNLDGTDIWVKLIGGFNAYNILAAYGALLLSGIGKTELLAAISAVNPVEGRFDYLRSPSNILAIIDYAHTPDALENIYATIASIRNYRETLITVVGAGGNRDAAKRPVMGKIAAKQSDRVIITSDNPRFEDPEAIINEIMNGVEISDKRKVVAITDRSVAIKTACAFARPGDIILIAGKGHEKYQEIKGVKYPFDDRQVVCEIFLTMTNTN